MSQTNQDRGTTSKSPNGLVILVYKFTWSITKSSNKIHELLTYNKP